MQNLFLVNSDTIQTNVNANLDIKGDRLSANSEGLVTLENATLKIPDQLPIKPIDLKEEYIVHPFQKDIISKKLLSASYPIHLDFEIGLENPLKVIGSGLNSTWDGHLSLKGTYTDPIPKGKLNLIKGSYLFSGRNFILHKGSVNFSGDGNKMPNLDIEASMEQQGIDVIANLKGPLDTPKIIFTSKPPLSASSIMSLLLFGKEITELSADQTIALSNTMNQKLDPTSEGSSSSSSSLGIDRFNVSSDDSGSQAIQLGKYITKGVVVSFSQGAEQGSSNVIVEVDLKHGFVFQAETQQQEEQGKFSLKYRHNY